MAKVQYKGWNKGISVLLLENDIVEITAALKHYHDFLLTAQEDWPEVRASQREIIRKLYHARQVEDQDPVRERESN